MWRRRREGREVLVSGLVTQCDAMIGVEQARHAPDVCGSRTQTVNYGGRAVLPERRLWLGGSKRRVRSEHGGCR